MSDDNATTNAGSRSWRVRLRGRSGVVYEERHGHTWRVVELPGERLVGTPSFVVGFGPVAAWRDTLRGRMRAARKLLSASSPRCLFLSSGTKASR